MNKLLPITAALALCTVGCGPSDTEVEQYLNETQLQFNDSFVEAPLSAQYYLQFQDPARYFRRGVHIKVGDDCLRGTGAQINESDPILRSYISSIDREINKQIGSTADYIANEETGELIIYMPTNIELSFIFDGSRLVPYGTKEQISRTANFLVSRNCEFGARVVNDDNVMLWPTDDVRVQKISNSYSD